MWICRWSSIAVLSLAVTALSGVEYSADEWVARTHAHAAIGDIDQAVRTADLALEAYPDHYDVMAAAVEVYAQAGQPAPLLQAYRRFVGGREAPSHRHLVEKMAWAILDAGEQSSMPTGRLSALLGAYVGNDSRGADIVLRCLGDSNAYVRGIAIEVAGAYPDKRIQDALVQRWSRETVWTVKMQLLRAFGRLRVEAMRPKLMAIVESPRSRLEERAVAIEAIVNMTDDASREQVELLAESTRAGLRMLACRVVTHLDNSRDRDVVTALLSDPHHIVRQAAAQAWGLGYRGECDEATSTQLVSMMAGDRVDVSIAAAWCGLIAGIPQGQATLQRWIESGVEEHAIAASAALAAGGVAGQGLLLDVFREADNAIVRANLALGIVGLRAGETELQRKAAEAIEFAILQNRRLCWAGGLGRGIAPLEGGAGGYMAEADAVDQMTRLELLGVLAIVDADKAQNALEKLLYRRRWGMSGVAAALLLQEGNTDVMQVVRAVMVSAERSDVRTQAALVLALWGRDPEAVSTLESLYETADRQLKERIIEGIGRVGHESSIDFLIDRLEESSETLRLLSAASLIQTLNH